MESSSPYRPRVSRETRLLLTTGVLAVAALWLLARIRFEERPAAAPVPSVVTLALAAAGWLLLTRAASETDERVFGVAVLLLVGGVADALSRSALFGGLVGGVFWRYAGRQPRDTIARDVLFVPHPLLMLVLPVAGARAGS